MPAITVRKFRMHYDVQGKGFPIIFVHGLGSDSYNWQFQVSEFSKKYRVYTIDLRGHGQSEAPEGRYDLKNFTEDVAHFIKAQQIAKCYYVGLSMGGMIGQYLAITHPELIEALVLADTSPTPGMINRPGMENQAKMFENSALTAEKHGREPLADVTLKLLFTDEFIEKNPEIVKGVRERIASNPTAGYVNAIRQIFLTELDIYPHLEGIEIPTLVIAGRQDKLTPIVLSERIHQAIKGSELRIIENCGHASCIEKHKEFNDILAAFLKKRDTVRFKKPAVVKHA